MRTVKVRILPPQPIPSLKLTVSIASAAPILSRNERSPGELRTRPRLILRRREARFDPAPPTAVHRFHVGVAHFLQVFRRQRRAKPAAAIQDDLCVRVWNALHDIALNDALTEVHGAG
jgi:hypothetical protein